MRNSGDPKTRLQNVLSQIANHNGSSTLPSLLQRSAQSDIQNAVSQAQSICTQLGIQIQAQNPDQLGGHSYGWQPWKPQPLRTGYGPYSHSTTPAPTLETLLNKFEADVKEQLSKLTTNVGKTPGDNNSVHAQLDAVKNNVDGLSSKLHQATQESSDSPAQAVDNAITQVTVTLDAQLKDGGDKVNLKDTDPSVFQRYKKQVKQDSLTAADSDVNNLEGALPEKIKGIRTQVETDFQAVNAATKNKKEFATLSEAITSNLKSLTDTVSQVGQKINAKLTELKSKIGKKEHGKSATDNTLQKIHENLEKLLNNELNTAIQNTDNLLKSEVSKYQQQCIQSLESHVDSEVKEAIEKLTAQANKNYVTSIKEMLNAFADRVQKELKPLPTAIDTDRKEGFKGFMRTMQGVISNNETSSVHINLLSSLASESTDTAEQKAQLFKTLYKIQGIRRATKRYLDTEIKRLYKDINAKKNPPVIIKDTDKHPYADALDAVQSKLNTLLDELHNSNHFTHSLTFNLGNLSSALHSLVPTNFEGPCNTLLDVLKTGLTGMHAELKKAYVSVYDDAKIDWADEKNPEKEKCAKILVTIMETVRYQLNRLQNGCKSDKNKNAQINLSNGLGKFLKSIGFGVSEQGKHNGELQDKEK
ncbi:hypothetical protein, conserved [Babesia ovata]|uniref:Extracellular matrix-binding ebh n=1 Tax=Babesia ovata TaxID=189622 RepID=A0A2H6KK41_9APIC|nr:uncharacterized protein BOVATA_048430 [Babesia ovata]GBE63350.1 hypothetical protein, conserved [Babesia ovata]